MGTTLQITRYHQFLNHTCGVVASEVLLATLGYPVPRDLKKQLGTTWYGTHVEDILRVLNRLGLRYRCIGQSIPKLKRALDTCCPVLVSYEPGKWGHVAVIYGFDDEGVHIWNHRWFREGHLSFDDLAEMLAWSEDGCMFMFWGT
ncbi:hypothetical protein G0Q06_01385 [Puniceicoccales bacterium CK1056]|uniref:Peptidase C39 domain-containing protein n=1 Tax=Oceanipulchritudo coccoides TaxID=2706888 RepID=A0A6B2M016_9BACT|nr:C39 family peptidase [Oceanipulchritudo coccoides]NDV61095.1 hypothetical protein [Oceanipulchritudo coccoides]